MRANKKYLEILDARYGNRDSCRCAMCDSVLLENVFYGFSHL